MGDWCIVEEWGRMEDWANLGHRVDYKFQTPPHHFKINFNDNRLKITTKSKGEKEMHENSLDGVDCGQLSMDFKIDVMTCIFPK